MIKFWPKQKKFKAIYEAGLERLNKDFDLMNIIKDIRYLKMLTKFQFKPDEEMKFQINHCMKNLINLDKLLNNSGV